ncbi:MAG: MCE family protein, partial [Actinobacteria bacterium]|nr:MCE family protein [Actinomycetota bacterium]
MERIRNRPLEILLGLLLVAVMVSTLVVIWASFSGDFSDKITVEAQLAQAGDALEPGDIVTYQDVIIGEVASAAGDAKGGAQAKLLIDPAAAAKIPAAVTAVAVPASLFGTTKIELLPTATGTGPMLRDGDIVAADRTPTAEGLQTALANVYTLLTSVHPAQLDAALSALAEALQGQGGNIGRLVSQADDYLRALAPHLPELDQVITSLATVTDGIARNAPQLLDSLANTLVIAKGILTSKQALASLLAVAPNALDNADQLFDTTNDANAIAIFRNEVPVAQALAANPDALSNTIHGFKVFADTFATTMNGSSARATLTLTGANISQILTVLTTGVGHMFDDNANPTPYTSADCPRYDGADGPNCGGTAGSNSA